MATSDNGDSMAARLQAIHRLRDEDLITDAEFETQQARILDEAQPVTGAGEQRLASSRVLMTTLEAVPGREIARILGLVSATAVRGRIAKDVPAVGLREIVGGGVTKAAADFREQVMDEAREEALARIEAKAEQLSAEAIVALRMTVVSPLHGMGEAVVYGTAVTLA